LFKQSLSLICILAFPISAQETDIEEYIGRVTNVHMNKSNEVKIGIELNDDESIDCYGDEWPLYFDGGQSYSTNWLDFLLLANRTRDKVRIGFTANTNSSCSIEYLSIMAKDGILSHDDDAVTGDPTLTRTGQYGNIALINTNGLQSNNFTASHHYSGDVPKAAFDGHVLLTNINNHSDDFINRGIWLMKKDDENKDDEHWLQVEFNKQVEISSFRVLINKQSRGLNRSPKQITIQTSDNGTDFVDHDSFRLDNAEDQRILLSTKASLKFFRLLINSNYGDSFIEIDELELFAD